LISTQEINGEDRHEAEDIRVARNHRARRRIHQQSLSEVDWQPAEASTRLPSKPKRDMIAYDGQRLTLGDITITIHLTPVNARHDLDARASARRRRHVKVAEDCARATA
jgi:hypothetical protein